MALSVNRKVSDYHRNIATRRLVESDDASFARLNCSGDLERVGEPAQEWPQDKMEDALDRLGELAVDPAKGERILEGGVEEAVVALNAQRLGVFEEVSRETSGGAEFEDQDGEDWDVKSPVSPPADQEWYFSPDHHLKKVRKDLDRGDRVLFNLTRVSSVDRDSTIALFKDELSCDEKSRVLLFTDAQKSDPQT